ncbi:MAG: ribonuclease III domain-containing protein [Lachnospiraceae bacterium]|nr:ribonuclease III domain-containing protein [Lachnospiraceae bacterium]
METSIGFYDFIFQKLKENELSVEKQDICSYSPLTLAYIGDGIYELVVRSMIVTDANAPVNKLHKRSSELVKAETQAKMAFYLRDNDILEEEEMRVLKRGRNAQSYTKAKNASVSDYRWATGLEALIGYLYLLDKSDRMLEIISMGLKAVQSE